MEDAQSGLDYASYQEASNGKIDYLLKLAAMISIKSR
jgi:hypothetical protein